MLFETDGIRGVVGRDIDYKLAVQVGNSLIKINPKAKILIARDRRNSGQMLSYGIILGVIMAGGYICDIGVSSTPSVSYLTREGYDYGIVITASHNPSEYNGIKVFDATGKKISDSVERTIEKLVNTNLYIDYNNVGRCDYKPSLKSKYIKFIQSVFIKSKLQIAFDCANGVMGDFVSKLAAKLNLQAKIANKNDYTRVNYNCGATCPQTLFNFVKNNHLDVGFAFDGDGDRVIVATQKNIYDGDNILYVLSRYYKDINMRIKSVVGTIMSNMQLEYELNELGIELERTNVGDKYVIERLSKSNSDIGGEQSGHIILKNYLPTGDGLLTAIVLLNIFNYYDKDIDEIMFFAKNTQVCKNISVKNKYLLQNNDVVRDEIAKIQQFLKNRGRIIVRPSGTENKIRIMIECPKTQEAELCCKQISQVIESELCVE